MTVNTTSITSGPYPGNGTSDTFSYTFRVKNKTQLKVFETDDTGVQTVLTVDTDYTVASIGVDTGGIITRVAGNLPSGYSWFIRADYKLTQLTAFRSQGSFFPGIHEDAFDEKSFVSQQQQEEIDRSLKAAIGDDGSTDFTLPAYSANKGIIWDPTLKKLINSTDDFNSAAANANNSAAAALVSENAAAASLFTIKSVQLDSAAADPTLDGNGNAVTNGDWYFNTTSNLARVYNGTSWQNLTPGVYSSIDDSGAGTSIVINSANDVALSAKLTVTGTTTLVGNVVGNITLDDALVVAGDSSLISLSRKPIVTAGTSTAYTVALGISALETGRIYEMYVNASNTGNTGFTIKADATAAISAKLLNGKDPLAGQFAVGMIAIVLYNGTNYILLNPEKIFIGFSVYNTVDQLIPITFTKVNFDTAKNNIAGWFDLSTETFKPLYAGYYSFKARFRWINVVSGDNLYIYFRHSSLGIICSSLKYAGGAADSDSAEVDNVYFNGTSDTLDVALSNPTRTTASISRSDVSGYEGLTLFSGTFIGN